jgi:iron complex transport system substrate-binding protein
MHRPRPRRSRRLARGGTVVLVAALAVVGCGGGGSGSESEAGDPKASGATQTKSWSFPDGRGGTVELDAAPKVIAAQSSIAGGLWEYGIVPDGVFGPLRRSDGSVDPQLGLADPDDFESLGEIDSEINLDALAVLDPDVIVTAMWTDDMYMGISDAAVDEIRQIAPVVGIRVDARPITEPLAQVADFAEAVGAKPARVASERGRFETATTRLKRAIAAKPELQVVAASGSTTEMYVAYPPAWADLRWFQSLGLDLAEPEHHPTANGYWETLSWEQTDKYPADMILADARGGGLQSILDFLPATAAEVPAVKADQIVLWDAAPAYGYGNFARIVNRLAGAVDDAKTDVDS